MQVWGSWWADGHWGFACCHQTVRNSYCTGVAGEAAAAEAAAQMAANLESRARQTNQATEQSSVAALSVRLALFLAKVCLFGTVRTHACTQVRLFAERAPRHKRAGVCVLH